MLILCGGGLAILVGSLIGMYKICYAKRKKEDAKLGVEEQEEVIYSGKKQPIKIFNKKLAYLFKSPDQTLAQRKEEQELDEVLKDYSEEKKEVYASLRQEDKVQLKKKNSRGIIFALVIVLVIWIINTIAGYVS